MKSPLKGEFFTSNLSLLHSEKTRLDEKTAEWLAKVTIRDTDSPAATSVVTIRSTQSNCSRNTFRSNLLLAKTAAKQEIAHLRIHHLQEERDVQEIGLKIKQSKKTMNGS